MTNSYRATLKGNKLEWHSRVPDSTKETLEVSVVVLESSPEQKDQQGQRMAKALQALADINAFQNVDAIAWQKEQRQDRTLPNRDE
ncbi:MAG: hypothetical protein ACRCYY_20385 [Trueperaceae bacterium]